MTENPISPPVRSRIAGLQTSEDGREWRTLRIPQKLWRIVSGMRIGARFVVFADGDGIEALGSVAHERDEFARAVVKLAGYFETLHPDMQAVYDKALVSVRESARGVPEGTE